MEAGNVGLQRCCCCNWEYLRRHNWKVRSDRPGWERTAAVVAGEEVVAAEEVPFPESDHIQRVPRRN
jgi:hypothetical protein